MITLLEKLFIKNRQDMSPATRDAYGTVCAILGILLNLLLSGFKFAAGILSGSIAITADALNNLTDAGSSIVTLFGFRLARQKPDPAHPFGHGRFEYISGFVVSMIILIMAFELLKSSVIKIFHPAELTWSPLVVAILILSILVKGYMAFYNAEIGKKIGSAAMRATAIDSMSDMAATGAVLIATLISHYTRINIDGYCGVLVGILILLAGINAAKDTINPLLGQAPDPAFVKQVEDIVLSYDRIVGLHDLIVHNYGPGKTLISLHAEVPSDGNFVELHDTIDLIEHRLKRELGCHTVIHMDPLCLHDEQTNLLREVVTQIVRDMDERMTIHDFRIVAGPSHTNLIFDVVAPYDIPYSDDEVAKLISDKIRAYNNHFYAVIDVDRQLS